MSRWPDGYGRFVCETVTSTLDEAREMAAAHPAPFWVLAHRQTAARGRRGRPWQMPDGNFAATLLICPGGGAASAALRSFVMSLALFEACLECTGGSGDFALKWPNDVLLNDGKLAGILLESTGQGGKTGLLSAGVGVNLAATPDQSELEAGAMSAVSLLQETGVSVAPEDFLDVLAAHYATFESQFARQGFGPVRAAWLARAARLGQVVTARTVRDTYTGTFEDVDETGNLVLRTATGLQHIAAADVYF